MDDRRLPPAERERFGRLLGEAWGCSSWEHLAEHVRENLRHMAEVIVLAAASDLESYEQQNREAWRLLAGADHIILAMHQTIAHLRGERDRWKRAALRRDDPAS